MAYDLKILRCGLINGVWLKNIKADGVWLENIKADDVWLKNIKGGWRMAYDLKIFKADGLEILRYDLRRMT